ncbi:hypothetical protein BFU36_09040 [Sulfolobus sp. A20]|uniref:DUF1404 domain-containing protein n=2 Tax=Sulfolobaceae TaxID=118883 RepID=UPI000845EA69|nr:DUF1404 domain-containing protein [Sulfolobus sp. A20]TRM78782.1 DUF1404 domain-containing protein [Sulfolobus sp. A20-N-F8]TRM81603.1 DUF1404 domain-containing protein [Sulfolobus sp. A20-N-F6]TRM83604.1 DUF1404 domain-containing protein [Sulfolobus sp. F3]TRM86199.1 DUF1404 domain-containing protein [Sulfolobus sp. C3]TRM93627.1 DUF1404 domain-containing protein [Sulfolobus sp. A20-N-G8]TRM99779.1 DUF1404 domain-containing protein [Sulfolobus sp. E1]
MISLIKDKKLSLKPLILPMILLVIAFNPYVESLEFKSPAIYMISHYLVYFSGIYIGYNYFRGGIPSLIIGLIPAIIWHVPYFFSLGAAFILYRAVLEITLFLGGLLAGSSIRYIRFSLRISLFALWMLGDSALAIIFIVSDPIYSNAEYSFSPYPPSSLPLAGIAMFIAMNVFLAYVLSKYIKSLVG